MMNNAATTKLQSAIIKIGKYVFLPQKRRLYFNRQAVGLTEKESGLLTLFCDFANRLLPRNYALVSLWTYDTYFNARSMDVYVSRLRKLLKGDPDILIMNVHGKGFKMVVPQIEIVSGETETMIPLEPRA